MTLERQTEGPDAAEIVDKLKRTLELHRNGRTWNAFQNQEFERMEQATPGYGKYVKGVLDEAPEADRDRLFEFAYITYELPQMRLGANSFTQDREVEVSWSSLDLNLQTAVLEDTFGLQPDKNPKTMGEIVEEISSHVPALGEYVGDFIKDLQPSHKVGIDIAILAFVICSITRARYDPAYGLEPSQVIL